MSTLEEIERATRRLTAGERQELLMFVLQTLREEGQGLPAPRTFPAEQMREWMDEDERDMKNFRAPG